jgi:hypothetical protein
VYGAILIMLIALVERHIAKATLIADGDTLLFVKTVLKVVLLE